jgi:hypothetical protein
VKSVKSNQPDSLSKKTQSNDSHPLSHIWKTKIGARRRVLSSSKRAETSVAQEWFPSRCIVNGRIKPSTRKNDVKGEYSWRKTGRISYKRSRPDRE